MSPLSAPLRCQRLEPREVPAIVGGFANADTADRRFAPGAPIGSDGNVPVFNAQGQLLTQLRPFGGTSLGVAVDVGDVNRDGVYDIVCGLGPGGTPRVEVYSGNGFGLIAQYDAFDPAFRGGVNVAVADLDLDGRSEVIAGAGLGSFPIVRVLDGISGSERRAFFAFDVAFRGGVSLAAGFLDADRVPEIVAGAGPGGVPVIATFDANTLQQKAARFAFDVAFNGGVLVSAGDVDGDRLGEVIAGAGPGGTPVVRILDGRTLAERSNFLAAPQAFNGGIAPFVFDNFGSGIGTIFTAIGSGTGTGSAAAAGFIGAGSGNGTNFIPANVNTSSASGNGFIRAFQGLFGSVTEVGSPFVVSRQVNFNTLPPSQAKLNALLSGDFGTLFA